MRHFPQHRAAPPSRLDRRQALGAGRRRGTGSLPGAGDRSCQLAVPRGVGRQGHGCRAGLASCLACRPSQRRQLPARHVTPPASGPAIEASSSPRAHQGARRMPRTQRRNDAARSSPFERGHPARKSPGRVMGERNIRRRPEPFRRVTWAWIPALNSAMLRE